MKQTQFYAGNPTKSQYRKGMKMPVWTKGYFITWAAFKVINICA